MMLAAVEWGPVVQLTVDTARQVLGYSYQHPVAVAPAGDVWVVWSDERQVPPQLWGRRFDFRRGEWLPEGRVTQNNYYCYPGSVATDRNGDVHLVWHIQEEFGRGIWYKRYDSRANRWLADTLLEPALLGYRYPVVVATPGGEGVHIVWCGTPDTGGFPAVFYKEFSPDSGWLPKQQITDYPADHSAATVAVDSAGNLCVVWVGDDRGSGVNLIYCRRRVNRSWQDVELVSDFAPSAPQSSPAVAAGLNGNFHIVWAGISQGVLYRQIFHRLRTPSGFTPTFNVSRAVNFEQGSPGLATGRENDCHVVWRGRAAGSPGVYQLLYAYRDPLGNWSLPEQVTALPAGDVDRPGIAARSGTELHVVWQDVSSGNLDVFYRSGRVSGSGVEEPRARKGRGGVVSAEEGADLCVRGVYTPLGTRVDPRHLSTGVYLVRAGDRSPAGFAKFVIIGAGR